MQELYVYYKVDASQTAAARAEFDRLRAALTLRWPGLQCRLLMRPVAAGAVETWMEVYAWPGGYPDAENDWPAQLQHLATTMAGAIGAIRGPRHAELFEDIA